MDTPSHQKEIIVYRAIKVRGRSGFGNRAPGILKIQYFYPLLALYFYWKDGMSLKAGSIGILLLALLIWGALVLLNKSIGPLRLLPSGDLWIPNDKNLSGPFEIRKSQIAYRGLGAYESTVFLDAQMKVLGQLRAKDYEQPEAVQNWIEKHYAHLPKLEDEKQWDFARLAEQHRAQVGSKGFYPLLIGLVFAVMTLIIFAIRNR